VKDYRGHSIRSFTLRGSCILALAFYTS